MLDLFLVDEMNPPPPTPAVYPPKPFDSPLSSNVYQPNFKSL